MRGEDGVWRREERVRRNPRDASDIDHVETEANDHNQCPAGDGIRRDSPGGRPKFSSQFVNEPAAMGGCNAELEQQPATTQPHFYDPDEEFGPRRSSSKSWRAANRGPRHVTDADLKMTSGRANVRDWQGKRALPSTERHMKAVSG
ncbi:unnamed protein product [Pleuronectes platessa]|uniref:Uncharacterized protein n=1 Tax=Pleuronectes platessa TaxID=8262 RepID=A0A9N7VTZ9_PLEPL|nr:unnamed protein product [Pleuronectes platessa]